MAEEYRNQYYLHDARTMPQLPDESVRLMVTSPPYNVTKQYDDNLTLSEYLSFMENVFRETLRVLVPGGVAAINVANVGRKPYIPLNCHFIEILQVLGFEVIQEVIWDKAASAGGSCAWGSWMSASNPSLRDVHEYIILAQKPGKTALSLHLTPSDLDHVPAEIDGKKHTINGALFSNLWPMGTESAKRVNHPAPFRVELPYRLILLFSEKGDVILDPFMGVGSTGVAARVAGRDFVGYDISEEYRALALRRIFKEDN